MLFYFQAFQYLFDIGVRTGLAHAFLGGLRNGQKRVDLISYVFGFVFVIGDGFRFKAHRSNMIHSRHDNRRLIEQKRHAEGSRATTTGCRVNTEYRPSQTCEWDISLREGYVFVIPPQQCRPRKRRRQLARSLNDTFHHAGIRQIADSNDVYSEYGNSQDTVFEWNIENVDGLIAIDRFGDFLEIVP